LADQADKIRDLVNDAWKEALPALQQRLGSKPERAKIDLVVVDGMLDGLTQNDDSIEAIQLRRLREALVYEKEGRFPGIDLTRAFQDQCIEVYRDLLPGLALQKEAVFRLATLLT
jgi:hypothetical protein